MTPSRQEGQQDVPRRPTAHTFEQVNWSNIEEETRIGVLQEMVAILLNRLDDIEAAAGQREAALDSQTRDLLAALTERNVYSRGDLEVLLDGE